MKSSLTKLTYFIIVFLTISSCSLFDKDEETTEDGPEVGFFPETISYFKPNETTVNYSFDFIYDDANKLQAIIQSDATGFKADNIFFTYNNSGQIIKTVQNRFGDSDGLNDRITNFTYQNNQLVSYEHILSNSSPRNYSVDFNESTGIMNVTNVENPEIQFTIKFDKDLDLIDNGDFNEIKYAGGKGAFYYVNSKLNFHLLPNILNYYLFASKQITQIKNSWQGIEFIRNAVNKIDSNGMVTEIEFRSATTNESYGKYTVKYQQRVLNP